jgi:hypothetical protein
MIMYVSTYGKAVAQALANTKAFDWPYVVFTDTNGNWRVERYDTTLACHRSGEVYCRRDWRKTASD